MIGGNEDFHHLPAVGDDGVAYALLPANNGVQGRRDMPDCESWILVMIWPLARQDISGDHGSLAEHRLSPMPCQPLTSTAWDFLYCIALPVLDPVRTAVYGPVRTVV
jgi:hypothetical protein